MEADAALGRAARHVVSHPVADEDSIAALVHAHRDRHRERALGRGQDRSHALVELEALGGLLEVALGDLEGIQVLSGHGSSGG